MKAESSLQYGATASQGVDLFLPNGRGGCTGFAPVRPITLGYPENVGSRLHSLRQRSTVDPFSA